MAQQILNTRHMVAYQAGSVVSKEIIKKDAGTVALFAFDQSASVNIGLLLMLLCK